MTLLSFSASTSSTSLKNKIASAFSSPVHTPRNSIHLSDSEAAKVNLKNGHAQDLPLTPRTSLHLSNSDAAQVHPKNEYGQEHHHALDQALRKKSLSHLEALSLSRV